MPVQMLLSPGQLAGMKAVSKLGGDRLDRVTKQLADSSEVSLDPNDLHQKVAEALGDDRDNAARLLRLVLSLSQLTRARGITRDSLMEGLWSGISIAQPPWDDTERTAWENIATQFLALLTTDAVRAVSKANELAYEHANLFQSSRIVTDIRPIFNDHDAPAMAVDGAVISYTLRLWYDSRGGNHDLSLALDESDIHALKQQCERAIDKARVARDLMSDQAGLPTIIPGESNDEPE